MTRRIALPLAGLLLLGALSAARSADDPSPEPPADVSWITERGASGATIEGGPRGPTIRITGAAISGAGSLKFKAGMTPAKFTIRMMNNKRPMQSFTLSDGTYILRGEITSGTAKAVTYWERGGRSVDLAHAAVTLTVETTKDGHIDVQVRCAKGVELGKELKVNWSRPLRTRMLKD
jgi:hypothetical protein